jgi:hypothetical protein
MSLSRRGFLGSLLGVAASTVAGKTALGGLHKIIEATATPAVADVLVPPDVWLVEVNLSLFRPAERIALSFVIPKKGDWTEMPEPVMVDNAEEFIKQFGEPGQIKGWSREYRLDKT